MSLCLSANASPLPPSSPGRWKDLGSRLRRMALAFAVPQDEGDMLPAPPPGRLAVIRERHQGAGRPPRAGGDEVSTLLL
ncbi:hypothetical protein [Aureimonas sp. AU22]|uniref:hypothetical protein n=1 Tax=Aureimonas sp. AU22 TaxID=1638162 RepID=UPI000781AA4A|nr:hypothetical protein [Aureimonas sp. AU22]